jgi:peptidoglycan/LPS O-acetylase OafA/YrhL
LTLQNLFGLFPHADLFNDLNSPLWFITLLLANYLLLPLIWIRRAPWLTALLLAGLASIVMIPDYPGKIFPSFTLGWMYRLHMYAFPLGITLSWLLHPGPTVTGFVNSIIARISRQTGRTKNFLRAAVCLVCFAAFIAASTSSFVGSGVTKEIVLSLSVGIILIAFWIAKPVQSTALTYIGTYSFELYLLHWPLLSRYNPLFAHLPLGFATIISLSLLLVLSRLFHYGNERLQTLFSSRPQQL